MDPTADHAAGRRAALARLGLYAISLGTLFGALLLLGAIPSADEAREFGESLGPFAALAYIPLFAVVNFVVAWAVLAGAAGLLFGTVAGWPLALAGVTLAALTQMNVARRLAKGHHGNLLPQRTRGIEDFLQHSGTIAVMESRIVPFLPYGVVNFAAGLTRLTYREMAVGTLVGAAPKVFAYVALGGSISNLHATEVKVAVGLLVVLGVVGLVVVKRQMNAAAASASP
ncbi:MAG: TVP38/TMEM64 family protein [Thermoleophilaceae bacterium]|nr:TVP38/TMEM64 family protein [Thermoleophilaceae bacterium]